jgi:hypothetical protein
MKRFQIIVAVVVSLATIINAQEMSISSAQVRSGKCEVEIYVKNSTSSDIFIPVLNDEQSAPNYYFLLDEKKKEVQIRRTLFQYPHAIITDMIEPCYTS